MKNRKSFCFVTLLLLVSLFFTTSCSFFLGNSEEVTISQAEYERLQQYQELFEIHDVVNQLYYEHPDNQALLDGAAAGLLSGLDDPYTFFYTPEEYAEMMEEDEGEYAGVGMQLLANFTTDMCTVTRVFQDSPAFHGGVLKGDVLLKVEDLDVNFRTLQEAVDIMRGSIGEPVTIQILRNKEILELTLQRAVVHINWVSSCVLEGNVGYLSLYEFSGDCAETFEIHLNKLLDQGIESLIIDLRDNPGGWLDAAISISDLFLPKSTIATMKFRSGIKETFRTKSDDHTDIPLVVLINENSASASEIIAGALQDYDRATIVGTTSYGKGVVQYVLPVGERGAAMQLTVAQYYTPHNHEVHKKGISVDIEALWPEGDTTMYEIGDLDDHQLNVAYQHALTLIP